VRIAGPLGGALFWTIAQGACADLDPRTGPVQAPCADVDSDPAHAVSFGSDIRPLMNRLGTDPTGHGCIKCHYSTQPKHIGTDQTGLDLSSLGTLRRGGITSGTHIVLAGRPCESAIVQKLEGDYFVGSRMPRDGPPYWSPSEIQLVIDWIAEGASGADDE
jgi:hypothetical protein